MAKDFRTNQIRTSTIIGSGSLSTATPSGHQVGLVICSGSGASDFDGGYVDPNILKFVGDDVWMVVSGTADHTSYMAEQKPAGGSVLFLGDVVVSGTLWAERSVIEVDNQVIGDMMVPNALVAGTEPEDLAGGVAAKLLVDPFTTNAGGTGTQDGTVSFNIVTAPGAGVAWRYDGTLKTDVFFHVSGSRDVRNTNNRGLALFDGDVHVSGNFSVDEGGTFTTDIILDNDTTAPPVIKHAKDYGGSGEVVYSEYAIRNVDSGPSWWHLDIVHSGANASPSGIDSGIRLKVNDGATDLADRSAFVVSASGDIAIDPGKEIRFAGRSGGYGPHIEYNVPDSSSPTNYANGQLAFKHYYSSLDTPTSFNFTGGVVTASNGIYLPDADTFGGDYIASARGQTRGIMFAGSSGDDGDGVGPGDAGIYYNEDNLVNEVLGGTYNTLCMVASNTGSNIHIEAGNYLTLRAGTRAEPGDIEISGSNDMWLRALGSLRADVETNILMVPQGYTTFAGDLAAVPTPQGDVKFFVSGAVGGKHGGSRSIALFGGDLVTSGVLYVDGTTGDGGAPVYGGSALVLRGGITWDMSGSTDPDGDSWIWENSDDLFVKGRDHLYLHASGTAGSGTVTVSGSVADVYAAAGSATVSGSNQVILLAGNDVLSTAADDHVFISGETAFFAGDDKSVPVAASDVHFLVSGSLNTRHTSTRGTALFTGDLVTSGVLYADGAITDGGAPGYGGSSLVLRNGIAWDVSGSAGDNGQAWLWEFGDVLYLKGKDGVTLHASGTDGSGTANISGSIVNVYAGAGSATLSSSLDTFIKSGDDIVLSASDKIFMYPEGGKIYAAENTAVGYNQCTIDLTVPAFQLRASDSDYFQIDVGADGSTIFTTVDGDANAANLTMNVDGAVDINAVSNVTLDVSAGPISIGTTAVAQQITIGGDTSTRTEIELNAIAIDVNAGSGGVDIGAGGDITLSGSGDLELIGTTGVTIRGDVSLTDNLTVFGDFIKGHVISASIQDPVLLLNSGSLTSNSGGGIAIASGSNIANVALVFGRDVSNNNSFLAGRLDVQDGDEIDFTGAVPVDLRAAGLRIRNMLFVTSSHGSGGGNFDIDVNNPTDGKLTVYTGDGSLLLSSSGGNAALESSGGTASLSASADTNVVAGQDVKIKSTRAVRVMGNEAGNSHPSLKPDIAFYVSGAIGSQGGATRGTSVFGGDLVISGNTHTENIYAGEYIYHRDDDDTFIRLQGDDVMVNVGGTTFIKMSELAAAQDKVVINGGQSDIDFRVASVNRSGALLVDAAADQVLILSGGGDSSANEANYSDTAFFVSGSVGSKDGGSKGAALFGGDLATSGALYIMGSVSDGAGDASLVLSNGITWNLDSSGVGDAWIYEDSNDLFVKGRDDLYLHASGAAGSLGTMQLSGSVVNIFAGAGDVAVSGSDDISLQAGDYMFTTVAQAALFNGGGRTGFDAVGSDTVFFVSGAIGSKDGTTRGTTVVGGALVVSGAISLLTDISLGDGVDLALDAGDKFYFNGLSGDQFITGDGTTLTIDGDDTVTVDYDVDTNFQRGGVAQLTMGSSGFVWNEDGLAGTAVDFRVESNTREGAIFIDASEDQVLILSGGGDSSDNEASYTDTAFFVSGSVGSKGGGSKGAALFGGDLVLSGNLHAAEYIYHDGDDDTFLRLQADNIIANVGGLQFLKMKEASQDEFVINEGANDIDFRVQSSNLQGMLLLDAAEDQLLLGTNSTDASGESLGTDTNIFISGSIDSMDSTTKGTAVFGGDLYVSGTANLQAVQLGNLTLTNTNAYLRFYDTDHYVRKNGTNVEFRDSAGGTTYTLTQLAALSVTDNTDVFSITHGVPSYVVTTGSFSFDTDGRPTNYTPGAGGPGADTYFFISGSKGVKDTATRGAAVFGGDTLTSGTIYLGKQSADDAPSTVTANAIALYASASAGVTQLYFRNSVTETKIGSGGSLDDAYDTPAGGGSPSTGAGAVITVDGQPVQFVNTGTNIAVAITGSLAFQDTSSNSTPPMVKSLTEGSDLKFGNYISGGGSVSEVFKLTGGAGNIMLASNKKVAFSPSETNAFLAHKTISSHGGTTSAVATRNFVPDVDNTYTLGTAAYRWSDIYTGDLHLKNDRGDWTILEEADMLVVVNNLTGKRYKMNLTPLEENE